MNKKVDTRKSHSIRMLVVYGIVVFSLILISLFFRIYNVINESKFDGRHRFTLAIGENEKIYGLLSFEPINSSLSLLEFTDNSFLPFSILTKTTGILPDGFLKTRYNFVLKDTISASLQSFIIHANNINRNVTFYDLLSFWFYANKIPVSTVSVVKVPVSSDANTYNKISSLLFTDSVIMSENISIQIINATGKSGIGSRLERVINNLGGNVVSVATAKGDEQFSKIQYSGNETHTLQKLSSLLGYKKEKLNKKTIADIVIIIGRESQSSLLF